MVKHGTVRRGYRCFWFSLECCQRARSSSRMDTPARSASLRHSRTYSHQNAKVQPGCLSVPSVRGDLYRIISARRGRTNERRDYYAHEAASGG